MNQRPSGGIASAMNEARGAAPAARPGQGITDTQELARLIALVRSAEAEAAPVRPDLMIGEFTVPGDRVPLTFLDGLKTLTRMESAVMRFLGWGRANDDIARLLDITETTVRTHMNNAIRKLGVDGTRELIGLAGLLFHPLD
jgi:DNA-binding NarL/FixJ family response regulator